MNDVEAINAHLDQSPTDWDARLVLADAYEDAREGDKARFQKFLAQKQITPMRWFDPQKGWGQWWFFSMTMADPHMTHCSLGEMWARFAKHHWGEQFNISFSTRAGAEDALRDFLELVDYHFDFGEWATQRAIILTRTHQ